MKCFCAAGKKLIIGFLLLAAASAVAGEVVFPYQRRWGVDDYLTYFLAKVPLSQIFPAQLGNAMTLSGRIQLNFDRLPVPMAEAVRSELNRALRGERLIAGARLDASQAEVVDVKELPPEPATPPVQVAQPTAVQSSATISATPPTSVPQYNSRNPLCPFMLTHVNP